MGIRITSILPMEHDPLSRIGNAFVCLVQGRELGEDGIVSVGHSCCGGSRRAEDLSYVNVSLLVAKLNCRARSWMCLACPACSCSCGQSCDELLDEVRCLALLLFTAVCKPTAGDSKAAPASFTDGTGGKKQSADG